MTEKKPPKTTSDKRTAIEVLLSQEPTVRDEQIQELQEALTDERDARREDRFIFIAVVVLLLDIMLFTVMPNFGGPFAILILQLLILIPLAKRMGMQEVAQLLDRALSRMAGKASDKLGDD